jgi:uncharacterized protein
MKIVYLHGLESNNISPKNDWLRTFSELFDPNINYFETNIYQKLKQKITEFQPNIIIGSSMGGYFAYEIARELNIDAILFNPALHSRSFEPDMTGYKNGNFEPRIYLVLGKNDIVINPSKTLEILGNEKTNYTLQNHEHGTPLDVFKKEIIFFIDDK